MLLNNKVYVVGCCIQEKEGTLFWVHFLQPGGTY